MTPALAYSAAQRAYDAVLRPHLPRTWRECAGIQVRDAKPLDRTADRPDYKPGLVSAIREHVSGRTVTLVGFGRGVSTAIALQAGATHVRAVEASAAMIPIAMETLVANGCPVELVTVEHALVGPAIDVYGDAGEPREVAPHELGPTDILVMDCEASELPILEDRAAPPAGVVIVETHPGKGAPTDATSRELERLGYAVETRDLADPNNADDKRVLVGRLEA